VNTAEEQQEIEQQPEQPHNILNSYIPLNEPNNQEGFTETLHQVKRFQRGENSGQIMEDRASQENLESVIYNGKIYRSYWLNNISSEADILRGINWIWEQERQRSIVKMTFSFGVISETTSTAGISSYQIYSPSERGSLYNNPVVVDNGSLPMLKQEIINKLHKIYDENEGGSMGRKIAVYNINVNVYNLMTVGAIDPIIHSIIEKSYAFSYEGTYNICWFAIGAFEEHYRTNTKRMTACELEAKTKQEFMKYVHPDEADISTKSTRFKELLQEYSGFNINDIENYMKWKNYNIRQFSYDMTTKKFKLSEDFINPNPDENTKTVNIAIVYLTGGRAHTIYIKDIEKATGQPYENFDHKTPFLIKF
jgi:hypothetical protein